MWLAAAGLVELAVGLVEEFLGLLGVAVHVPFVGFLGLADAVEGLVREALGGGEVGVAGRG